MEGMGLRSLDLCITYGFPRLWGSNLRRKDDTSFIEIRFGGDFNKWPVTPTVLVVS